MSVDTGPKQGLEDKVADVPVPLAQRRAEPQPRRAGS